MENRWKGARETASVLCHLFSDLSRRSAAMALLEMPAGKASRLLTAKNARAFEEERVWRSGQQGSPAAWASQREGGSIAREY